MSQANQPVPPGAAPAIEDDAPRTGMRGWHVALLVIVVAAAVGVGTYVAATSGDVNGKEKEEDGHSAAAASVAAKPVSKLAAKKKKADSNKRWRRECSDGVFVNDCRSTSAEELRQCGLCVDESCKHQSAVVRCKCLPNVFAIMRTVANSGRGTVNTCEPNCTCERVN